MPLKIVDAHFHLWDRNSGNYGAPRRAAPGAPPDPTESSYLLEQFLAESAGELELCGAVHVEALANDPLVEARFVEVELKNTPCPTAMVVRVDLISPNVEQQLDRLQSVSKRVRGVRHILNHHLDPALTFTEQNLLSHPDLISGLKILADRGMRFDLQIYPHQMMQAVRVLEKLPGLGVVLDHAGMWADRSFQGWQEWKNGLCALAEMPDVRVKLSGLGKFDPNWTVASWSIPVFEVIEQFGPARVMFASNYPIERRFADYVDLWRTFEQILSGFSAAERHQMLVQTAWDFYRLEATA